jgi:chromosome segregation ATPase
MCKKLIVAAVAILVGTAVVKNTSVGSLAQVWWRDAKQAVERQVPPEVQIKRLANEVSKIDADIKQNLSKLAQQEVDTQKLDDEVASLKDRQASLRAQIKDMTVALDANNAEFVSLGGKSMRSGSVARKLDLATATYQRHAGELKSKESVLAIKREALETAHTRIAEMTAKKEQLHTIVEDLEYQLQLVRLNATRTNAVELDDTQVNRCVQLANDIRERLKVQKVEAELNVKYGFTTPMPKVEESKSTADVLKAAKKALEDETEQRVAGK